MAIKGPFADAVETGEYLDPRGGAEHIMQNNPVITGTEKIDGKSCWVIEFTDLSAREDVKAWVWKDKAFPIRVEMKSHQGPTMLQEYKNIDFGNILDSEFELPAGVEVIDLEDLFAGLEGFNESI